jgi:hypothetical protein
VHQLKSVQNRMRRKVKPKMLNGKILNGPMLLELCKSYIKAINQGNVPCIENAWSYVLKYEADKLIKNLVNEYITKIKAQIDQNQEESQLKLLHEINDKIISSLVTKFHDASFSEESQEHAPKLIGM